MFQAIWLVNYLGAIEHYSLSKGVIQTEQNGWHKLTFGDISWTDFDGFLLQMLKSRFLQDHFLCISYNNNYSYSFQSQRIVAPQFQRISVNIIINKNGSTEPRSNIPWLKKIIWVMGDWSPDRTLKMVSAQVVATSVSNNSLSEDFNHPDDLFQSRKMIIIPQKRIQ